VNLSKIAFCDMSPLQLNVSLGNTVICLKMEGSAKKPVDNLKTVGRCERI